MNNNNPNDNLYLHKRTKLIFDGIAKYPPNATLITGEPGSGKFYVASQLANLITGDHGSKMHTGRYTVEPNDNQTITIDQVRELSMATHHSYTEPHTIIIKNIQYMTTEAQNAFLKILEEPPSNVYFILTCISKSDILPTIFSRCQELPIIDIGVEELSEILASSHPAKDSNKIKQAILQHDSKIGTIIKSLNDNAAKSVEHDYTKIAKQLLASSTGERVIYLQQYFNMSKSEILSILKAMMVICKFMFENSVQTNSDEHSAKRWSDRMTSITYTEKAIKNNGNSKIQLLNLMSSL